MHRSPGDGNVVLIGMPGVGKSTLGVLLAKATARNFIDTDVYVQACTGQALQDIIDTDGAAAFRDIEERAVRSLHCRRTVIATGGSVVYSEAAMEHLRAAGTIVHLHLALPFLRARLADFGSRGVVMSPGQSLESLFAERDPLYRRHADVTVDCGGKTHAEAVTQIIRALGAASKQ